MQVAGRAEPIAESVGVTEPQAAKCTDTRPEVQRPKSLLAWESPPKSEQYPCQSASQSRDLPSGPVLSRQIDREQASKESLRNAQ